MSPSARRFTGTVPTERFDWQTAMTPRRAPLAPLVFHELAGDTFVTVDPHQEIEARELQLPSVAAQHIEAIEQRGFDEGFARGQRATEEERQRQYDAAALQIAATVQEIADLRGGVMRRADRELIHLAIAMAERIVRRELKTDPNLFLVMVRAAIERLGERPAAVVHLNPIDYETVVQATAESRTGTFELVADNTLPRGGCVIRSSLGVIDASIDAQVRELTRELLGVDSE